MSTRLFHLALLSGVAFLFMGSGSCKKQEIDPEEALARQKQTQWRNGIDSILSLGGELYEGKFRQFEPREDVSDVLQAGKKVIEHKTASSTDVVSPGFYRKVQRTFSYAGFTQETDYVSNLNAGVIWPGNIIYANSLKTTRLVDLPELNKYRVPGCVTMAVLNGNTNLTRDITNHSYAEVNKQLNDIVASVKDDLPANLTYSINTVRTLGEAAYYLRIPEEELRDGKKYKEFQSIRWTENTLKAVITFSQDFFTLVYGAPETGAGLFNSKLTPEILKQYTGKGNPLGYISSVTYGRRFFAVVEETRRTYPKAEDLEKALSQALPNNDKVKKATNKVVDKLPAIGQDLRNVKIYLHLVGGKDIFTTNVSSIPTMAQLNAFVISTAGGKGTHLGVPVSCVVKYLHGGMKTIEIPRRIKGQYSFIDYMPEEDDNKITLSGLRLTSRGGGKRSLKKDGRVEISNDSFVYIEKLDIAYSVGGAKEEVVHDLAADYRWKHSYQDNLDIRFNNISLPAFGKNPTGYIRIHLRLRYHTVRYGGGTSSSDCWIDREARIRYNTTQHKWYVVHSGSPGWHVDKPFQHLGYNERENYCPINPTFYYQLSTEVGGAIEE